MKRKYEVLNSNFQHIREIIRKFYRLDISEGTKKKYDSLQQEKINEKFDGYFDRYQNYKVQVKQLKNQILTLENENMKPIVEN